MSKIILPKNYKSVLSIYETQTAIGLIKRIFEDNLSKTFNLRRVSAPLFVEKKTGLNDDLSGVECPVQFDIPDAKTSVQIVHSLAKWKRMALYKYGFSLGEGLYTDMNAIRCEEEIDNLHSIYVDQWDWELVINQSERTSNHLKDTVKKIVEIICDTQDKIQKIYPRLGGKLLREVSFVTAQELENMYPELTPEEREYQYVKKHPTTFIEQIGDTMKSGNCHGKRSPDYDDWSLNGDIIFWNDLLGCPIELSSMGIRVNETSLAYQLKKSGCEHRRTLTYHKALLEGKLPLTMGGGIGQSRLCLLLLQKAHIGEVQVSVWDNETVERCKKAGIELL